MAELSLDLKRRVGPGYLSGNSGTYLETADLFGVGQATAGRLLRRYRETGEVKNKPRGGNNPRRINLAWLREHSEAYPDARLGDRVQAWERSSGIRVHVGKMGAAMQAIGWTHKKRHQ